MERVVCSLVTVRAALAFSRLEAQIVRLRDRPRQRLKVKRSRLELGFPGISTAVFSRPGRRFS